jgi:hypothetical protein
MFGGKARNIRRVFFWATSERDDPSTWLTENPFDRRTGPKTGEPIKIPEAALAVTFWHPMMMRPSLMPATP